VRGAGFENLLTLTPGCPQFSEAGTRRVTEIRPQSLPSTCLLIRQSLSSKNYILSCWHCRHYATVSYWECQNYGSLSSRWFTDSVYSRAVIPVSYWQCQHYGSLSSRWVTDNIDSTAHCHPCDLLTVSIMKLKVMLGNWSEQYSFLIFVRSRIYISAWISSVPEMRSWLHPSQSNESTVHTHTQTHRLRDGVSYVKVCRYNTKHLCPNLNGYRDNGQRKVWSSGGSTHCTCQLTRLIEVCPWVWCPMTTHTSLSCICASFRLRCVAQSAMLRQCFPFMCLYSAWNPKDNYDMEYEFSVVQFNGFMSHTSYFDVTNIIIITITTYTCQIQYVFGNQQVCNTYQFQISATIIAVTVQLST
jgi:hypothetical protein